MFYIGKSGSKKAEYRGASCHTTPPAGISGGNVGAEGRQCIYGKDGGVKYAELWDLSKVKAGIQPLFPRDLKHRRKKS